MSAPASAGWARRRPWRLVMGDAGLAERDPLLDVGTPVMVRTRYLHSWTTGFEVAELLDDGYRLRRVSDGGLLADQVGLDDVRPDAEALRLRDGER